MAMTDPIADFLTRVRNAASAGHESVDIPASRIKANISRILKQEGYIENFRILRSAGNKFKIRVHLKYMTDGSSCLEGIQRRSRPGLRTYVSYEKIPFVRSGLGISILSTSKGIMSGAEAKKQKVGGELLCSVW